MELRSILADNPKVEFVIDSIKAQSRVLVVDVICAYNLFADNHPDMDENAVKQLDRVYDMCKYMEPDAEDVVSMLLFRDNLINKASMNTFLRYFSEKRYERYHEQMAEACRNAPKFNPKDATQTREDCIGYYIMQRVCDKMFNHLIRAMNKNRITNAYVVSEAYNLAKEAHDWSVIASGAPYIIHPIRVAGILVQIGVESSVIAAALLHDAVEKTDCTLEDVMRRCDARIAKYVDAVTSVHTEFKASHHISEYRMDKSELDHKSFKKLVNTVASNKEMIFALYIKAADIMDNLRDIDHTSGVNIHDTNDLTQLNYLPLFKAFKLDYFVQEIENLMWRATDIERYTTMKEKYDDMLMRNREFLDEFCKILDIYTESGVNNYAQFIGSMGYDVDIYERQLLPYEVYNCITESGEAVGNLSKRINKRFVPVCDIDIVPNPRDARATLSTFVAGFVKMFEDKIAMTGRTVIDFNQSDKSFVFEVEDHYRNVFRCRIILREEYDMQRKGVYFSGGADALEEESDGKTERINVQLRNGKNISMPKGSTVLDVAFAIHEEIGLSVKSATINGKRAMLYHTLLEGDQVIIEADTRGEDGRPRCTPRARINWLNWVVTKKARRKIIDYLCAKYYIYEGDDPKDECEAQTAVVNMVADNILAGLRSAT